MYRTTGAGKEARPPAMMAMATLVQGYLGISDAEMIELTVLDLRVQIRRGLRSCRTATFRVPDRDSADSAGPNLLSRVEQV